MITFNVGLKRQVTTTERKTVQIQAGDADEASRLGQQFAEQEPAGWTETDACEVDFGDAQVESVKLHAFSDAEKVA